MRPHRILVAVDGSDAGRRALAYVAEIVGERPGTTVRLLHLLPRVPPRHLEHGGAEHPAAERALDEQVRARLERWVSERESEAQGLFDEAQRILEEGGVPAGCIERECRPTVGSAAVARECLEAAEAGGFATIVLSRETMPWYRDLLHRHQSDLVIRRGHDVAIWVVE